jgi:hypothetical protein
MNQILKKYVDDSLIQNEGIDIIQLQELKTAQVIDERQVI